jgi:hypothetical protein
MTIPTSTRPSERVAARPNGASKAAREISSRGAGGETPHRRGRGAKANSVWGAVGMAGGAPGQSGFEE